MATSVHTDDQRATQTLSEILAAGMSKRASDIHLEPRERHLRVRFRIDGVLTEQSPVPKTLGPAVLGRVKILANLDVAEKRVPQDGGFTERLGTSMARFRVSTLPTDYGEKIVLRLLTQRGLVLDLKRLGMKQGTFDTVTSVLGHPDGVILVTGPTGSGKTSTLYSMLRQIDSKSRNVVTLEDPIEIRFPDIIQTQIHPKAGYTFAIGLRAILRQDPDVVLVGEMRDRETADTALKAGLTGHMVLSSLHTNSAIETFLRLVDMGLDRFVVAGGVRAVVAQRLVRKLCEKCKMNVIVDEPSRALLKLEDPSAVVFEPVGCPACNDTGFQGRTAIFEVIDMDDDLADLMKQDGTSRADFRRYLAERGIPTLRGAGFELVRDGVTSMKEVARVT